MFMPRCTLALLLVLLAPAVLACPPPTKVDPVADTYFSTQVTDDYRWLEDNASATVDAWNKAQNDCTRTYLDALPERPDIKKRLTDLITATSPSFSDLQPVGGRIFAIYNDPKFQQPRLVVLGAYADPANMKTVLDPNALDQAGLTAMDWYVPSHDGRLVAVSLSQKGSEDGTLHVYETDTGKDTGEKIPRVQYPTAGGSLAWAGDDKGFWYTRYPGEERPEQDRRFYMQVFFHTLGADWAKDPLVLGTEDGIPRIGEVSFDNRYAPDTLLVNVQNGDGGDWSHWLIGADGRKAQIDSFKDKVVAATVGADHALYLVSRASAPNGKVLKLAPGITDLSRARTIIREGQAAIIIQDGDYPRPPTLAGGRLLVSYIVGGPNEVRAFDLNGKPLGRNQGRQALPEIAAFSNIVALPNGDALIGVASYLRPYYIARLHPDGTVEETRLAVASPVKFDDAVVERRFAVSRDGTKVPVNIVHEKGMPLDGSNPALLYGYGGYGISQQPHFLGAMVRLWLDGGGVYAEANTRGGAEYGERWHDQGRLTHKQNVFDDFAAAGNYLVKARFTSNARLALRGGSNGGLLMGAMITQHPGLARAVVSAVGIYDMLRVELDPNGAFNTTEFGSVKDPAQFKALYAYSPYQHVRKAAKYPAVLMLTGANDGRVNPMQSRKFCAALQAATASSLPVYLRISTTSGHGIGSSLSERIDQLSDQLAFLFDQLRMHLTEG